MRNTLIVTLVILALMLGACAPAAPTQRNNSLILVTDTPEAPAATQAPATLVSGEPSATDTAGLQYDAAPPMTIDPAKIYLATFKTEQGDIVVELFADKAPVTVNNFVFLARQGFYDNTTFHRVLADFMAQGGDPTGTGSGGPGYRFQDELHPDLRFDEPGLLAMANSGPDTNGSQFFITFVPTPQLTGVHTIFGKVVEGMDVALALTQRDPETNPDFLGSKLLTVEIEEVAESRLPPPTATPVPVVPEVEEGRPLAALEVAARENLYTGRPAMVIDPNKTYVATITTSKGEIVVELYPADAPESVNNFVVLANLGYWDGFPINFVQPDQFVLTGSPSGQPDSDIGYTVPSEVKRTHAAGAVGYWYRADRLGSSGSEFYLLLAENAQLDAQYTVFGAVTAGLDVAATLTVDDVIETITIAES